MFFWLVSYCRYRYRPGINHSSIDRTGQICSYRPQEIINEYNSSSNKRERRPKMYYGQKEISENLGKIVIGKGKEKQGKNNRSQEN